MARVIQTQRKTAGVRRADLDDKLVELLEEVGRRNNVYFEVYSGGQNDETGYVGSVRHDHGNAADLRAYQVDDAGNKRYITSDTPSGQALWKNIASSSIALGATGVGMAEGYMGTDRMHIGFGNPANHGKPASSAQTIVWGAGGKSSNAPRWLVEARDDGLGFRKTGLPTPPGSMGTDAPTPMPPRPFGDTAGSAVPLPRVRPAALPAAGVRTLGGDLETPLTRLSTTKLGWEDDASTWDGTDIRAPIDRTAYARARLEAGNVLGGAADDRMRVLGMPQTQTAPSAAPTVAPMPMPGRPNALASAVAGGGAVAPMLPRPVGLPSPVSAPALDETMAEQSEMRRSTVAAPVAAPSVPPAVPRVAAPPPIPAPVPSFRAPVITASPPTTVPAGVDVGSVLGGLGNALGQGMNFLGNKAQEAAGTLGTTANNVVEGTKTALGNTAEAAKAQLADELLGTVKGRTLLLNTAMGIPPRRDPAADRAASAPEGYGYGSTGKKLYKIGQTYQSSRGPVVFNGSGFQPVGVKTEISVTPSPRTGGSKTVGSTGTAPLYGGPNVVDEVGALRYHG